MYPILGRYGPFLLYSFTVFLGAGIGAGIALTAWKARRFTGEGWNDALLMSLLTGLMGARIGFVAANWDYFQIRPSEMWQLWRGGLNYHGALFAGLLGLWAWCAWHRRYFLDYANLFAPGLALAGAFGWFACRLEGCAFGREVSLGPFSADLPDTFGIYGVRYQTQLLGLAFSLLIFLLLLWIDRRPGTVPLFWLGILGLSLGRIVVSSMRADIVPQIGGTRLDMIIDGALALGSVVLLQYKKSTPAFPAADMRIRKTEEGCCESPDVKK